MLDLDAAMLARTIREQSDFPLTDSDSTAIARSLETAADDEAFLSSTLAAVQLLLDRLEPPPDAVRDGPATGGHF